LFLVLYSWDLEQSLQSSVLFLLLVI
jgi:hypothetical protein